MKADKVNFEKLYEAAKTVFDVAKAVLKEKYESRRNNILAIRDPPDGYFVYAVTETIVDIYLEDKEAFRNIKDAVDYITKVLLQYPSLDANDKAYVRAIILSTL